MTYAEARSELTEIFLAIYRTMEQEGDDQWLRAVEGIIAGLQQDEGDREAVLNAFYAYDAIEAGYGSFSDYFLWRDDPYVMRAVNAPFEAMRNRAWAVVRAARTGELAKLKPAPSPPGDVAQNGMTSS